LGFKKENKTVKQKEEEQRREEEQQESIVLEKPRRASFSFDKVEQTTTHIVGRRDESFDTRPINRPIVRPANTPAIAPIPRPRNTTPQHGGKQFPVRT
jgi:hypothetical protein